MKITIINTTNNPYYSTYKKQLKIDSKLISEQHSVDVFNVYDMDINNCCGCFSCWRKTPGRCIYKDDMESILKQMVKTDWLFIVTPLAAGFIASDAKRVMDRMIPTLMPYIRLYDGECHHLPRYEKRINLGLLIIDDGHIDDKAIEINFDMMGRFSKNLHSKKTICKTCKPDKLKEVILDEVSNY